MFYLSAIGEMTVINKHNKNINESVLVPCVDYSLPCSLTVIKEAFLSFSITEIFFLLCGY